MAQSVKHIPSLGLVPVATSVPSRLCGSISPHERLKCVLAPHVISTAHSAYDPLTDATSTWFS